MWASPKAVGGKEGSSIKIIKANWKEGDNLGENANTRDSWTLNVSTPDQCVCEKWGMGESLLKLLSDITWKVTNAFY